MRVGDMVYFWTGRGSHGYATIRGFDRHRVLLDPEPDAVKGSDATRNGKYWYPRDTGVPEDQIDTPPNFWWTNY